MNNNGKLKKYKIKETFINTDWFIKIYVYFHLFITTVALIIFYSCSKKEGVFNKRTFMFALCWPHIYIMYIAGTQVIFYCFSAAEEEDSSSSESSEY
mgnify:FL=1